MRAILLASATATFSRSQRARRLWIDGLALTTFERSNAVCAPMINSRRMY
jgi:hypothetical protein